MNFDPLSPRTIAVAQLAFIGDMVFTTPLLLQLRQAFPEARIVVVGRPGALDLLVGHASRLELLPYDKLSTRAVRSILAIGSGVRQRAPDLFLGVSRSARTSLLSRLSGAPIRVGFRGFGQRLAYNRLVSRDDRTTRFPERPLRLLSALGVRAEPARLNLTVSDSDREAARLRLRQQGWNGGPLVGLAPGANYYTKRWPERHVSTLLDRLGAETDWQIALFGGPLEEDLIARLCQGRSWVLDRRGIGVRGVMEELSCVDAYVGGDSGPAHIARALGVPTLILHGPTAPEPLADALPHDVMTVDLPCRPCSPRGDARCPLVHHRCLEDLDPQRVIGWIAARGGGSR